MSRTETSTSTILYVGGGAEPPVLQWLRDAGYSVTAVADVAAAVAALERLVVDLILLPAAGPVAAALLPRLEAHDYWRQLPVLALTAAGPDAAGAALVAGAGDCLRADAGRDEALARVRTQVAVGRGVRREYRETRLVDMALDGLPFPILVLEADGRIVLHNQAAGQLFGVDLERRDFFADLPAPAPAVATIIRAAVDTDNTLARALEYNGREFLVSAAPVSLPGSAAVDSWFVSVVDLTAENARLEQIRQARKMESVRILAAGVAHDLNNILGGMIGYISLLRAKTRPDDDTVPMLDMIDKASDRATEVVSQLLSFARSRDRRLVDLDLSEEVRRAMPLLRSTLGSSVRLTTDLAEGLPPVPGDSSQLGLVINNLARAAERALQQGGRIVVRTAVVPGDQVGAYGHSGGPAVILQVRTNRAKAAATTTLRIAEPQPLGGNVSEGAGLGLAIVRDIVQDYGGLLKIEYQDEQEVVFTVVFPIEPEAADRLPPPAAGNLILVVDDENIILRMIADCFDLLGYEGLFASSGQEGIDLFHANADRIRLVILDLVMPDVNGLAVLEDIRELRPDMPVLVTSGYDYQRQSIEEAYGPNDFLNKPFKLQDLRTKLDELLQ